jgi:hypothetical protein
MKIDLDTLMTDFFKSDDTVTVSASDLQKLLLDKENQIIMLKNDLKASSEIIQNLTIRIHGLENKEKSNYTLDLKG